MDDLVDIENLEAIGYTSDGERLVFKVSNSTMHDNSINRKNWKMNNPKNRALHAKKKDLISLEVPKGFTHIYCLGNKLTSLKIEEGVRILCCQNNSLTELNIPDSIEKLQCDKEVKGLEYLIGNKKIKSLILR